MKFCEECWRGEIKTESNNVRLTRVIDPDTGYVTRREMMCEDHREMHLSDGYVVQVWVDPPWQGWVEA